MTVMTPPPPPFAYFSKKVNNAEKRTWCPVFKGNLVTCECIEKAIKMGSYYFKSSYHLRLNIVFENKVINEDVRCLVEFQYGESTEVNNSSDKKGSTDKECVRTVSINKFPVSRRLLNQLNYENAEYLSKITDKTVLSCVKLFKHCPKLLASRAFRHVDFHRMRRLPASRAPGLVPSSTFRSLGAPGL
ncbi:hypothetical protein J6590_050275 [Homalodisca vitripennis]|nr:hypothetical protein J6590_050275 [Homalodisca vitripennis]